MLRHFELDQFRTNGISFKGTADKIRKLVAFEVVSRQVKRDQYRNRKVLKVIRNVAADTLNNPVGQRRNLA